MDPFLALKKEYLANAQARLTEMEAWLAESNLAEIQSAAHKLAGSGGFYGFDAISQAGLHLEALIKSGAKDVRSAIDALGDAVQSAVAALEGQE